MTEAYESRILEFITWMDDADTDPDIAAYFTSTLLHKGFPTNDLVPPEIQQAAQEQSDIGWDNVLFGRLSTTWMELQASHYKAKESRRSPERWAADMTYRLLQVSHGMWTTRNKFLHERDEQGLLLEEGQSLKEAMTSLYLRGYSKLLPADFHLLSSRSLPALLALPPADKYTWLGAIKLAHKLALDSRHNDQAQMRASLSQWIATGSCRPSAIPRPASTTEESDEE